MRKSTSRASQIELGEVKFSTRIRTDSRCCSQVSKFRFGAVKFVWHKGTVRKDLLDTIRAVRAGRKILHAEVAVELATHAADDALSEREIEVLSLIAAGNSNKLVADQLAISEDTVKSHVKSILSKLGVNDRTHAVTAALKRGIIEL
jgi:DNA-binding NarL/FixJ family response regulator